MGDEFLPLERFLDKYVKIEALRMNSKKQDKKYIQFDF